jgi:polyhydroxyalkanoate synthesis regulator phasin
MRRFLSVAAIAAVLLATVALTAALGTPRAAEAQETQDPEVTTEDEATDESPATLTEILSELVEEGVITQDQADRIEEAIEERGRAHFDRRGHGFRGHGGFATKPDLADILGLTPEELREALADGTTLGEIANETEGVSRQDLVDALVEAGNERIDAALEADRITEDEAAGLREQVAQHAEDVIDGEVPDEGFKGRGFRGPSRGRGRFGPPTGEDASASTTSYRA